MGIELTTKRMEITLEVLGLTVKEKYAIIDEIRKGKEENQEDTIRKILQEIREIHQTVQEMTRFWDREDLLHVFGRVAIS